MNAEERLAAFEAGCKAARRIDDGAHCPPYLTKEQRGWWARGNATAHAGGLQLYQILRQMRLQAAQERGTHTWAEWDALKARHGQRCAICNDQPARLTRDHIVSISNGGSDAIDNIQPACPRCNSVKGTKKAELFKAMAKSHKISPFRQGVTGEKCGLRSTATWPSRPDLINVKWVRDEEQANLYWRWGYPYLRIQVNGVPIRASLYGCLPKYARRKVSKVRQHLAEQKRSNWTGVSPQQTVRQYVRDILSGS